MLVLLADLAVTFGMSEPRSLVVSDGAVLGAECGGNGRQTVRRRDIRRHMSACVELTRILVKPGLTRATFLQHFPRDFSTEGAERWNGRHDFGKKFGADSTAGSGGEWWELMAMRALAFVFVAAVALGGCVQDMAGGGTLDLAGDAGGVVGGGRGPAQRA